MNPLPLRLRRIINRWPLCLLPVLLPLCLSVPREVSGAEVSPRVAAELAAPDGASRRADGRLLVWVRFSERALAGSELERVLNETEAELLPRVRARRVRNRPAGVRPVDESDLPVPAAALAAVRATGARLRHVSRWLNAASFLVTDDQIQAIADLRGVASLDLVARSKHGPQPTLAPVPSAKSSGGDWSDDYGLSTDVAAMLDVPAAHALGLTGAGVVVGILDSGFRTTHEALRHIPVLDAWDFVDGDPVVDYEGHDPINTHSHGTVVLSNIAAYKQARIMSPGHGVSVLLARTELISEEIPAEEDNWVAGIEWAEARGADIVSSSLIYKDWYDFWDYDGDTALCTRAADEAARRGVLVVAAAGNDRGITGTLAAPADADSVVTVGAVDAAGVIASFSSPGPTADSRLKPEVVALGVSNPSVDPNWDREYGTGTGTSFATPLVTGVAALILERAPGMTPMQVREALMATAVRSGAPNNDYGWGVVQAGAAAVWYGPQYSHVPPTHMAEGGGPYRVTTLITARLGLSPWVPQLVWRVGDGPWQSDDMAPAGGFPIAWEGAIPGQAAGARVDYYFSASDAVGVTVTEPVRGGERFHTFTVGPDSLPPTVRHHPLGTQTLFSWPPTVTCTTTDNSRVTRVDLHYRLNNGAEVGPFAMGHPGPDSWSSRFPLVLEALTDGDELSYSLTARDDAAPANETVAGPWQFQVQALATRDTTLSDTTPLAIPDAAEGIFGVLVLDPAPGEAVWEATVDIDLTHPDPSQLQVELISPGGVHVRLHDGGSGGADLVGNWPASLPVSGPGSLADLVDGPSGGIWFLTVRDDVPGGVGTLNGWQLNLSFVDAVSSGGDDVPGAVARLEPAVPNPFNPRTEIAFVLGRAGRTRLSVYDLRGMLVRELLDAERAAGPHRMVWDGRDRTGRTVGSGVYLYRLVLPDGAVHQRKMTLVR